MLLSTHLTQLVYKGCFRSLVAWSPVDNQHKDVDKKLFCFRVFQNNNEVPLAWPVQMKIHLSARVQRPCGAGAGEVEEEDHFVGDPWSPFPLRDVVSSSWELRPRLQSVTRGIFQECPWAVASSSLLLRAHLQRRRWNRRRRRTTTACPSSFCGSFFACSSFCSCSWWSSWVAPAQQVVSPQPLVVVR